MTVVYLDSFVLVNLIMNYLLLLASGKLAGERLRPWRFFWAALFGALYAACSFFPKLGFSLHPLYKISVALLMLLISFGRAQNLLRISLVFFAISCAFCGAILGIAFLKGGPYIQDGIVYSALDVKGLLMSAGLCYGVLALFFRRSAVHHVRKGDLLTVTFEWENRTLSLTALQDSGNTLQDPISGQQIPVVEGARMLPFLALGFGQSALEHPIETIESLSGHPLARRFRLLPYRAIGVSCGMLLAVRLDGVNIQGERYADQLVALSPTAVSDGGAYQVLIADQGLVRKGEAVEV